MFSRNVSIVKGSIYLKKRTETTSSIVLHLAGALQKRSGINATSRYMEKRRNTGRQRKSKTEGTGRKRGGQNTCAGIGTTIEKR